MLYLIRHTTPDINLGICYGQTDIGVKQSFNEEVIKVKESLKGVSFSKIYSSPLKRCVKLAEELSGQNNIIYENRLMEMDFGDFEGKLWDDIAKTKTGISWMNNWQKKACPNGESFIDIVNRCKSFINDLDDENGDVCLVTHGGIISAFLVIHENVALDKAFERKIGFGEVVKIEKKAQGSK